MTEAAPAPARSCRNSRRPSNVGASPRVFYPAWPLIFERPRAICARPVSPLARHRSIVHLGYLGAWRGVCCPEPVVLIVYGDEASLNCGRSSFRTVRDLQFLDDAVYMVFDGILADTKRPADLFVGRAFGKQLKDFDLARGEIGSHHALRETSGDITWDVPSPGVHSTDRFHHLPQACVFEQIAVRACLHSSVDVFVGLKARQDDDPGIVRGSLHSHERVNSTHSV